MKSHVEEFAIVLFTVTLGCGARSGLDVFGVVPASGDARQTEVGEGGSRDDAETTPSSSGSGASSGGSISASSGSSTSGSERDSSPSCQYDVPGVTNCGAGGESCCTSLEVAGGMYFRTYTNSGSGPTDEAHPATISGFRLDKYEVTVGRFRQFVSAWNEGYSPPEGSGKQTYLNDGNGLSATGGGFEPGWVASDDSNVGPTDGNLASCGSYATWTPSAGSQENLPINCVNWYEAYAFCIWDGGFLPSEAQWEYAAAGGSQQREYPWGSADPGTDNQYAIYSVINGSCYYPYIETCVGAANIAPVGTATRGVGVWGQLDLAGNVEEWNLDWYHDPYVDPCTDCAWLMAAPFRVGRGGYFASGTPSLLSTYRDVGAPSTRDFWIGFRCSRAP